MPTKANENKTESLAFKAGLYQLPPNGPPVPPPLSTHSHQPEWGFLRVPSVFTLLAPTLLLTPSVLSDPSDLNLGFMLFWKP